MFLEKYYKVLLCEICVQCFIEQQGVRLISMSRTALKEYAEICLVFFRVVLYFLHIFKVYMNFLK
jgi:hypothetical protein